MKSVCLYFLIFILRFVCGQESTASCPDVFEFENSYDEPKVRGIITVLKPSNDHESVNVLEVKLNFTIAGPIIDEYRGHITATTTRLVQKYNKGDAIKYRVHFPATEQPPPKVTAVIINQVIICVGPGDDYGLDKRIENISIKHRSSDYSFKPKTSSRPVTESSVATPIQTSYLPAPRPVVTASPDHRLSTITITSNECGVVAGGNERVPLVNNGKSYERGEVPWLVAIYRVVENNLLFICGGTLVSDRHVVTAAHCLQRPFVKTPLTEIVVKVGVHSLNAWDDNWTIIRKLMAGTVYDEYDPQTLQNDIMVLTLSRRVKFNRYIRPACLWSGDTELSRVVGATGLVAGWGDRGVERIVGKQDEPQMVRVPIVSTKECRASKSDFHRLTYDTTLCADLAYTTCNRINAIPHVTIVHNDEYNDPLRGDRNGAGPCKGDSGGGLYLLEDGKWRLRGVVSISLQSENGALTCNLNEYVVFTDTAQFLPWIRSILSEQYYD